MSVNAIITLQQLQCIKQDRGSKGSSAYIWPAMVVIDLSPFLITVVPPPGDPRVIIQADMQGGQSAAIPDEIGVLARILESSDLTQHLVILVIALWEELDTPENVVDAGYQAFDSSLGPAFQANIAQLANPSEVTAATAAIKAAVNNAVTAAIEKTLSVAQKIEIWLGNLQLDHLIDSSSQQITNEGSIKVTFGGSAQNSSNSWAITGELQFAPPTPTTVVPDLFEFSATAAAKALRAAGLVPSFANTGSWVQSQEPIAGSVVAPGTTVKMSLRSGPMP
jgi:PASTA domain